MPSSIPTDVPKHIGKQKLNPEYVALWESYLDEGMSGQQVAEIFGVTKWTVRKYYPDKLWNRQQILEHSHMMKALNRL